MENLTGFICRQQHRGVFMAGCYVRISCWAWDAVAVHLRHLGPVYCCISNGLWTCGTWQSGSLQGSVICRREAAR